MKIKVGQITKATTKISEEIRLSSDGFLSLRHITSGGIKGEAINLYRPMFWFKDSNGICPALILSSNPILKNKETKPWEDDINPLEGKVHYYGDNKTPGLNPSAKVPKMPQTGNNKMMSLVNFYLDDIKENRELAPPIVVFQHCKVGTKEKGYRKFIGIGYLYDFELIEQETANGEMFSNYRYDIKLINLEDNLFDWQWILDRRSTSGSIKDKNLNAPFAWKKWIEQGHSKTSTTKSLVELDNEFNQKVSQMLSSGVVEKPRGNSNPTTSISYVIQIQRNPQVKAWILQNSNGICEVCNKKAPFNTDQEKFFLEVHHIKPLALGGSDTLANTIALCPNCHREIHHGIKRKKIELSLFNRISRLKKED